SRLAIGQPKDAPGRRCRARRKQRRRRPSAPDRADVSIPRQGPKSSSAASQLTQFFADVLSAHQGRADENRLDAGSFETKHVGARANAAFADQAAVFGYVAR